MKRSNVLALLESEAARTALQNMGKQVPGLYVSGSSSKLTKEQAFSRMLEESPEIYAAYRAQHNAKALVATLDAAGYQVVRK